MDILRFYETNATFPREIILNFKLTHAHIFFCQLHGQFLTKKKKILKRPKSSQAKFTTLTT